MYNKNPIRFLNETLWFPPVEEANEEGLLAVGGDLSAQRLLKAYREGIFPWFNEEDLILWWSPKKRMVLFPSEVHVSKSMKKIMKSNTFSLSVNQNFLEVITKCAKVYRENQQGTWITHSMIEAYEELHEQGYAVSYEVWQNEKLVGGLYGIDLGHVFCGESMFHSVSDASKFAFISLAQDLEKKNYRIIDCQLHNNHLASLGAREISRSKFLKILKEESS